MNQSYPFLHWIFTLFAAPFLPDVHDHFILKQPSSFVDNMSLYTITFVFSFVFSLPTFLIYFLIFKILSKKQANPMLSKIILISTTIIGIAITFFLIGGSTSEELTIAYSISALISGALIKIKPVKPRTST